MSDLRLPDLNKVLIAGRLTRDPDLKFTSSNRAVCKIRIANSRHYRSKDGERKEDTTFVDVTIWDKLGEWIGENLSQGRPVLVEGALKYDEWQDRQTQKTRTKLEITAQRCTPLDWPERDGSQGDGPDNYSGRQRPTQGQYGGGNHEEPIPEDDIPF